MGGSSSKYIYEDKTPVELRNALRFCRPIMLAWDMGVFTELSRLVGEKTVWLHLVSLWQNSPGEGSTWEAVLRKFIEYWSGVVLKLKYDLVCPLEPDGKYYNWVFVPPKQRFLWSVRASEELVETITLILEPFRKLLSSMEAPFATPSELRAFRELIESTGRYTPLSYGDPLELHDMRTSSPELKKRNGFVYHSVSQSN